MEKLANDPLAVLGIEAFLPKNVIIAHSHRDIGKKHIFMPFLRSIDPPFSTTFQLNKNGVFFSVFKTNFRGYSLTIGSKSFKIGKIRSISSPKNEKNS